MPSVHFKTQVYIEAVADGKGAAAAARLRDEYLTDDAATRDAQHRAELKADCDGVYRAAINAGKCDDAALAAMKKHESDHLSPLRFKPPVRGATARNMRSYETDSDGEEDDAPRSLPRPVVAASAPAGAAASGTGSTGTYDQTDEWLALGAREEDRRAAGLAKTELPSLKNT